jgi:hypothetical protein
MRSSIPLAALAASVLAFTLASCRDTTGPGGDDVLVCHFPTPGAGALAHIVSSELAEHVGHGDYVARLVVEKQRATGDSVHFARITDAIAAASESRAAHAELSAANCRIEILVGAGTFQGSSGATSDPTLERFPLVLDVPDVTLRGSFVMQIDQTNRATGLGTGGLTTTLAPVVPLAATAATASEPIIVVNAHPTGSQGHGTIVGGFVFQSGHAPDDAVRGGQAILSLRVHGLQILGNRFETGFTERVDLRASSAQVDRNYSTGVGGTCDICLAGPGDYSASDNRLVIGGIPGFLVTPATLLPVPSAMEQWVLPASAEVTATLTNNEVRDHLAKPVGAGIRFGAVGVGAPSVAGTVRATARGNNLVNNTFAMIVEAAFPVANTTLRGDITLTLQGNTLAASCQNNLLLSFSRHTTALGLGNAPYLRNSTYALTLGGDVAWSTAWYSHPAGLGNTLTVDGTAMPNGTLAAYDAAKACPAS